MREELATGLAGAKGLQAELKEGKRREDELRATNAILVAKSTPPPRAAAAGKTTWSDGAAEVKMKRKLVHMSTVCLHVGKGDRGWRGGSRSEN